MSRLLSSCPSTLIDRYKGIAERAEKGSRAAAIKLKCLECCAWSQATVNLCEIESCSLWSLRSVAKQKEKAGQDRRGKNLPHRFGFAQGVRAGTRADRSEQPGLSEQADLDVDLGVDG